MVAADAERQGATPSRVAMTRPARIAILAAPASPRRVGGEAALGGEGNALAVLVSLVATVAAVATRETPAVGFVVAGLR